jgi:hypothetical protein
MNLRAEVVVASNRAASGVYEDLTGPLIVSFLQRLGFEVDAPVVVPDGERVGAAISTAAAGGARVVLTTGGTGLTPAACSTSRFPASRTRSGRPVSTPVCPPPSSHAVSPASSATAWSSTCPAPGVG